jgi:hypothetical protein
MDNSSDEKHIDPDTPNTSGDELLARQLQNHFNNESQQNLSDYASNPPASPQLRDIISQERVADRRREVEQRKEREYNQAKQERDLARRERDAIQQTLDTNRTQKAYDMNKELRLQELSQRLIPTYSDIYNKESMKDRINKLIKKELNKETTLEKEKTDMELVNIMKSLIKKPKKRLVKKPKKTSAKKPKKTSAKKPKKTSAKKPKKTSAKKPKKTSAKKPKKN